MVNLIYSKGFKGMGISHVERDCDFTKTETYYKNQYQIHYILKGERYFYSEHGNYQMKKGTLALVDKKQIPYTNIVGGDYHERFLLEIDEKWLLELGNVFGYNFEKIFDQKQGVWELSAEKQEKMQQFIQKFETDDYGKQTKLEEVMKKNELLSFFDFIIQEVQTKAVELKQPMSKMQRYAKVREIVRYLIEHCCELNSLEEVADLYYLDKSYLSRIFKEVTNFTVNDFIHYQRIGQAREMIIDPEISIAEMSEKLGYTSQSYFCRVFEKLTGMSPLQYRKSKLNKKEDKEETGNI